MSDDPDIAALRLVSERFTESLELVDADDWIRRTPCDEWDVQALVDHVVGGNWFTGLILGGDRAEEAMSHTMARFGSGNATAEQARVSTAEQLSAFDQPGVFERLVHHVAGELTGRQVIRLRLHDLIAHTWDLEQSLGRDSTIPGSLVAWGLDELSRSDSLTASFFDHADSADDRRANDDGDPTDGGVPTDDRDRAASYLRLLGRASR